MDAKLNMTTLVVGASGATGRLLVEQLLELGQKVKIVVRSTSKIPDSWISNKHLTIIVRDISGISSEEMSEYIADCQSVASCLGHNLTWKGIFGKPKALVANSIALICEAIFKNTPDKPVKLVLMNTAGNSNRDIEEPVALKEKIVIGLLRFLLPPHYDNEQAADYLRVEVGHNNPFIEWSVVRPDNLLNEANVTNYSLYKSPIRSAIFDPGKTSRINVGDFMARLILEPYLWSNWKGQMPVIYNENDQPK